MASLIIYYMAILCLTFSQLLDSYLVPLERDTAECKRALPIVHNPCFISDYVPKIHSLKKSLKHFILKIDS